MSPPRRGCGKRKWEVAWRGRRFDWIYGVADRGGFLEAGPAGAVISDRRGCNRRRI